MLVVRVELHSAVTGKITTIATLQIANVGGTAMKSNYKAWAETDNMDRSQDSRTGDVVGHDRLIEPVWNLVIKALKSMGYSG